MNKNYFIISNFVTRLCIFIIFLVSSFIFSQQENHVIDGVIRLDQKLESESSTDKNKSYVVFYQFEVKGNDELKLQSLNGDLYDVEYLYNNDTNKYYANLKFKPTGSSSDRYYFSLLDTEQSLDTFKDKHNGKDVILVTPNQDGIVEYRINDLNQFIIPESGHDTVSFSVYNSQFGDTDLVCENSSIYQEFILRAPENLSAKIEPTLPTCGNKDGFIKVTPFGGIPLKNVDGNLYYEVSITDGLYSSTQNVFKGESFTFDGLEQNNYKITVKDMSNFIYVHDDIDLSIPTDNNFDQLVLQQISTSPTCSGKQDGSAIIKIKHWSNNSDLYTVKVKINNEEESYDNFDFINKDAVITINSLNAGDNIDIIVSKQGFCATKSLNFQIPEFTPVSLLGDYITGINNGLGTVLFNLNGVSKNDKVEIKGEDSNYSHTFNIDDPNKPITFGSLENDTYSVTYIYNRTDSQCSYTLSKDFDINIDNSDKPSITLTQEDYITCNGGNNASLNATFKNADKGNYNFLWYIFSIADNDFKTYKNLPNTDKISDLYAGTYKVIATHKTINLSLESNEITIEEPSEIQITVETTQPKCYGDDSGFKFFIEGGTPSNNSKYNYSIYDTKNSINRGDWDIIEQGVSLGQDIEFQGAPASYLVEVTDSNGCTKTSNIIINKPNNLYLSSFNAHAPEVPGGVGKIVFEYSGNPTEIILQNLDNDISKNIFDDIKLVVNTTDRYSYESADIIKDVEYKLTIKDATCESFSRTKAISTSTPSNITINFDTTNHIYCNDSLGSISASLYNPNNLDDSNFKYQWYLDGAELVDETSLIIEGLKEAGSYKLLVTNNGATVADNSVSIEDKTLNLSQFELNQPKCYGENGSITEISVKGGFTTNYKYEIKDKAQNSIVLSSNNLDDILGKNLQTGEYSLIVTSGSCDLVKDFTINSPSNSELIVSNIITDNATPDANDGSISLDISGGSKPYTVEIYNSDGSFVTSKQVNSNFSYSQLEDGNYTFEIKDKNTCNFKGANTFTIGNTTLPTIHNSSVSHITCMDGKGSILPIITNLEIDQIVELHKNNVLINSISITNDNINSLPAFSELESGSYILKIKSDSGVYIIQSTNAIEVLDNSLQITQVTYEAVLCYGGEVEVSPVVKGGIGNITYSWYKSSDSNNTISDSTNPSLGVGNYKLIVSDSNTNTCTAEFDFEVTGITVQPSVTIDLNSKSPPVLGDDGSIEFTISDFNTGNQGYKFYISDNSSKVQIQPTFNNNVYRYSALKANTDYQIIVENDKGCSVSSDSFSVGSKLSVEIKTPVVTTITCKDNKIELESVIQNANDLTGYTYKWYKDGIEIVGETSDNYFATSKGDYKVSVNVDNKTMQSNVISINEDFLRITNLVDEYYVCYNETVQPVIEVSGGVLNNNDYTYTWVNKSSNITYTGINPELSKGQYTVTVLDSNGCDVTGDLTIDGPNNPFEIINLNISNATIVNVANGSVSFTLNGDYEENVSFAISEDNGQNYQQLTAGNYSYSNNQFTYSKLAAKDSSGNTITYNIKVTDNKGCTVTSSGFSIDQPSAITINNITDFYISSCGESVTVTVPDDITGGIPLIDTNGGSYYLFEWYAPGSDPNSNSPLSAQESFVATQSGDYLLKVKDQHTSVNVTVTVVKETPLELDIVSISNNNCFNGTDGSATLEFSGGSGDYSFELDGTTLDNSSVNNGKIIISSLGTSTIGNPYKLTIIDKRDTNCSKTVEFEIKNNYNEIEFDGTISKVEPIQNGSDDGKISFKVRGGSPDIGTPYKITAVHANDNKTYNVEFSNNTYEIAGLKAGKYDITITDSNSCTIEKTITLNEPPIIELDFLDADNINCFGGTTFLRVNILSTGAGIPDPSVNPNPLMLVHELDGTITSTPVDMASKSITVDKPGDYYFAFKDKNGITGISDKKTITSPSQITLANDSVKDVTCISDNDGSISVTINADSDITYQYTLWNVSDTADTITGDFINDTNSKTASAVINNLTEGTYNVEVTSENGCSLTDSNNKKKFLQYTIGVTPKIQVYALPTSVSGYDNNDGKIEVKNIFNATEPFEFQWSGPNSFSKIYNNVDLSQISNASISGLDAGVYTLNVKDASGCNFSATYTVGSQDELTASISKFGAISCSGSAGGSLKVISDGGVGQHTIAWYKFINGSNDELLATSTYNIKNDLGVGVYYAIVTDANGNQITTDKQEFISPSPVVVDPNYNVTIKNISCSNLGDGSYTFKVSGGSNSYLYSISNSTNGYGPFIPFTDGSITTINNLLPGTYTVKVADNLGCALDSLIEFAILDKDQVELTFDYNDLSEFNIPTGSIYITNSKNITGTATFTLISQNGTSYTNTNGVFENLSAGDYSLSLTHNGGACSYVYPDIITIKQPRALTASIEQFGSTQKLCNGAENAILKIFNVSGGQGDLKVTLMKDILNDNDITNDQVIKTFTYNGSDIYSDFVSGGMYYVVVTDSLDTSFQSESVYVEVYEKIDFQLSSNLVNLSCNGDRNQSISLQNITGGNKNYYYRYAKKGYVYSSWISVIGDSATITDLGSGDYLVQVKDGNSPSCYYDNDSSATAEFKITEPEAITATFEEVDVLQFGDQTGEIKVISKENFTNNYKFTWYSLNSDDLSISSTVYIGDESSSNMNLEGQSSGKYQFKLETGNGCTFISNVLEIKQPQGIEIVISNTNNNLCHGSSTGEIKVESLSGGIAPYKVTWYKGINENNAIEITNNNNNPYLASYLPAGNYFAKVTDVNNKYAYSKPVQINEAASFELESFVIQPALCYGASNGSIELRLRGGSMPYSYELKSFDGTKTIASNTFNHNELVITDLPNLPSGYYLSIQDKNNCTINSSEFNLSQFNIDQPRAITLISTETNIVYPKGFGQSDGEIYVEATGGSGDYIYKWYNSSNELINQNTNNPKGLAEGEYYLIIESSDCDSETFEFSLVDPSEITVDIEVLNSNLCSGANSASLTAQVNGGTPFKYGEPYTYRWYKSSDKEYIIGFNKNIEFLRNGSYFLVVTDANGVSIESKPFVIKSNDPITISFDYKSAECVSNPRGEWDLTPIVEGGSGEYTYEWNTGEITDSLSNLEKGVYQLVVTDSNGCTSFKSIELGNPPNYIDVQATVTNIKCGNGATGEILLEVPADDGSFTYTWKDINKNGKYVSGLEPGDYTVVIKGNQCTIEKTISVVQLSSFDFKLVPAQLTLCKGAGYEYDVQMYGVEEYLWESDNGFRSTDPKVIITEAGIYRLTVKTIDGCEITKTLVVEQTEEQLNVGFILSSQAFVDEDIALINVSDTSHDYEWIIPDGVRIVQELENGEGIVLRFFYPGSYELKLRVGSGQCARTVTKIVNVQEARDLTGIDNYEIENLINEFKVFPNPAEDDFTATINLKSVSKISLRFYNLASGNVISDSVPESLKAEYTVPFSFNLPSGVYLLLLETSGSSQIRKVIIK